MEAQKKIIVVLGVHRSGTSAIARGLLAMGVSLGDHLLPAVEGDNDRGYWEDIDINVLNVEMLSFISSDWYHLKPIEKHDVEKLRNAGYIHRAIAMLQSKAFNTPIFGFKDPRTTRLLPFWKDVLSLGPFDVSYVLVIRNPISVAHSLLKVRGIPLEHSYLLWLGHVMESLAVAIENNHAIADYDLLIESPTTELSRISKSLQLELNPEELRSYENNFLSKTLAHASYTVQDVLLEEACPVFVREVYVFLLSIAKEEIAISDSTAKIKITYWIEVYSRMGASLQLLDQLLHYKALTSIQLLDHENRIHQLSQQTSAYEIHLNTMNTMNTEHLRKLSELEGRLSEREDQLNALNHNLADAARHIDDQNRRLSGAREEIQAIFSSTTWKITQPIRKIGTAIKRIRAYWLFTKSIISTIGIYSLLQKSIRAFKNEGFSGIKRRVKNLISYYKATGHISHRIERKESQDSTELIQRVQNEGPKISVIISIYKTPIEMLKQAIESVIQQAYKNWELILVDDFSESEEITTLCNYYKNKNKNKNIKYVPRSKNGNISAANNTGIDNANGVFYTILDHDDILDSSALYEAAKITLQHPNVDYIYSDEDKVTKDGLTFFGPFFKPDWSPEYMLAMMYTCHMSVFRTALVKSLGGYDTAFDGAQDYELTLRVVRKSNNVEHIAKVLYHWRVWENSTAQSIDAKPLAHIRARKALELHLQEQNENFVISDAVLPGHHFVDFLPKKNSLVSIVIPTANGTIDIHGKKEYHINAVCESIKSKTAYKNFEIIVVHNGNLLDDQIQWLMSQSNIILTEYIADKFSLSEKINQGAGLAEGEYLVIMNDDIRVISEDWLTHMLGMAQREGVGAVGPKLLFPDETIQHAGVVMLGGLPGHPYYQQPKNALGYALGLQVNRNYLAVTGACCLTPKSVFDKIGGYSNKYPLNYNDVDYCLKIHKLGLRSVYIANALLYHYEGVSKEGGRTVAAEEMREFLADWGKKYSIDPFYNVNLSQSIPYTF